MKALIVMDMQEITVGKNHAQVYYIKNLMKSNLLNRLAPMQVYQGSPEGELAEGLGEDTDNKTYRCGRTYRSGTKCRT